MIDGTPQGPLHDLRVALLGGIGPAPFSAMLLADLGADVIRVQRGGGAASDDPLMGTRVDVLARGQRTLALDLKAPADRPLTHALVRHADVLIEGFRPGAMERLGLGPEACLALNPRLVYTRLTGWGQDGPLAASPGHDIGFVAVTGALDLVGAAGGPPVPALNLLADFAGGGLMAAYGTLAAVHHARATGQGQVVDAAMFEGVNTLLALQHALHDSGRHDAPRGENLLDGGAPFNAVYACADGLHLAVGAIEPPFHRALLSALGLLDDPLFDTQADRSRWPAQKARIAAIFRQRPRADWLAVLAEPPCCAAPVLALDEAPRHPHAVARGSFFVADGLTQPVPAPRFSRTPPPLPRGGATTDLRAELEADRWPARVA